MKMEVMGWKENTFYESIEVSDEAHLRSLQVIKKRLEKTSAIDLSKLKGERVNVSINLRLVPK